MATILLLSVLSTTGPRGRAVSKDHPDAVGAAEVAVSLGARGTQKAQKVPGIEVDELPNTMA